MQPSQNTNCEVTVVILTGGASRRMQGRDKGMLPLHGKPLITHVIERLSPQADTLLLSCNENCATYSHLGYPLVTDSLPDRLGPLAGLLSALENSTTEYVLCVPCDTPYLPDDLLSRMCLKLRRDNAEVCSVKDGKRLQPAILLVQRHLAVDLKSYLLAGGRKAREWFERQVHCVADFSDQPDAFANINTPEELQAEDIP